MMSLLETVYSGEVACLGAAFRGGGGESAGAGCAGPQPGRDIGTRVHSNMKAWVGPRRPPKNAFGRVGS